MKKILTIGSILALFVFTTPVLAIDLPLCDMVECDHCKKDHKCDDKCKKGEDSKCCKEADKKKDKTSKACCKKGGNSCDKKKTTKKDPPKS